ncbi:laminin subunit alpha-4-like [Porites lutea]|uniref:laminin subunit alpha-4-like n=1 Tax=Porites lutea TaxID=51062 RepID=UPI003CC61F3C
MISDINECEQGTHNCNSNAVCNNTKGSYNCTCKPGYKGNGYNCTDVDECKAAETHNCSFKAFCNNTEGAYNCTCKPGYMGDGWNCKDSSTTSPAPRTPPETTNLPSTTEESSTLPPTTTSEPVTISPPKTTSEPTTSPPPTTTSEPTTSPSPTTTLEPTTTPAPTTNSEPTCTMPGDPAQLEDVLGFGLDLNSHALYSITGDPTLKSASTELNFSFRASNPNGIMLYTADEPSQSNFIECHLEDSKVNCSFGAGEHILKLITPNASYSDGKWHTVRLSKQGVDGTLYVDCKSVDSGQLQGELLYINPLERLFLGGVPKDFDAKGVPVASRNSFPGCIANLTVNEKNIDTPPSKINTQSCSRDSPESGVSFKNGGGYLKVADQYQVGEKEEISLEIKPTTHTGLLLSAWGHGNSPDYIVLEMSNGNIIFRAENGDGELVAEHSVDEPLHFCDGQWHKIQVWKIENTVRMQVDGNLTSEDGPRGNTKRVKINNRPLYVGGLPPGEAGKGVTVTKSYTGCVRNLVSRNPGKTPKTLYLANPRMMAGNLYLGGCPYNF